MKSETQHSELILMMSDADIDYNNLDESSYHLEVSCPTTTNQRQIEQQTN